MENTTDAVVIMKDMIRDKPQLQQMYYEASKEKEETENVPILEEMKPPSNLAQYSGTVTLSEDPLTFQARIRSER